MAGYDDDDSVFDLQGQEEVLRLIAARSPKTSAEAARALWSSTGAARQLRLDRMIPDALADRKAAWNRAERQQLIDAMAPAR